MTERIAIVTDSTCDLTQALREAAGIRMVSLSIYFGEQEYQDGVDLTPDEFFEKMQNDPNFPTTASPAVGKFLETYQALQQAGYTHIVSLHLSRKFSGTVQAATNAAAMMKDMTIEIFDTQTISWTLGLLAEYASEVVSHGIGFEELVNKIKLQIFRTKLYFSMDSLDALYRGGRIGKAKALIGKYLGIRPVLSMEAGEVKVVQTTNSMDAACRCMAELAQVHVKEFGLVRRVVIVTSTMPHYGDMLLKALERTRFAFGPIALERIGGVVGSHVGPDSWGIMMC